MHKIPSLTAMSLCFLVCGSAATIDRLTVSSIAGGVGPIYYDPTVGIQLPGCADNTMALSDGSTLVAGAGSCGYASLAETSVSVAGSTITYHLTLHVGTCYYCTSNFALNLVDYTQPPNSTKKYATAVVFDFASPPILRATIGSSVAIMTGNLLLIANDPNNPYPLNLQLGYEFVTLSAKPGAIVPFSLQVTLEPPPNPLLPRTFPLTWTPDLFSAPFFEQSVGTVELAAPVPEPSNIGLLLAGFVPFAIMRIGARFRSVAKRRLS